MKFLWRWIVNHIYRSIAFYPVLMTLAFIGIASAMIFLEAREITQTIDEIFPGFLRIRSYDVAQSLLSVLIGAMISLMVFSFSMVMVLLNNASSNLSPRILPDLISHKFHQFVLGFYLGTITYSIIILINLGPTKDELILPSVSVLLACLLGLVCLVLFVFFIHSISQAVQVNNILVDLYKSTCLKINRCLDQSAFFCSTVDISEFPHQYYFAKSGYLSGVDLDRISDILKDQDTKLYLAKPMGFFVHNHDLAFRTSVELSVDNYQSILNAMMLSNDDFDVQDYSTGMSHITEIALKAMSPGINDPGTAIYALDYLTALLISLLPVDKVQSVSSPKDGAEIYQKMMSFESTLAKVQNALLQYASHDSLIIDKLIRMIESISRQSGAERVTDHLRARADALGKAIENTEQVDIHITQKLKNRISLLLDKL